MKFGQLILRRIVKIVATKCQISRLKCTKINFGWLRPDPAEGAYSAPPDPVAGFNGALLLREGGIGRKGRAEGGEGRGG